MHSEKKLGMEDTWRTGDLEKHMRRGVYDEDNMRRKDRRKREEEGKRDRRMDSERRHRDNEREAHKERDRQRERDATGERTKSRDPDRHKDNDRHREGTRDRTTGRDERDHERRRERERAGERDRTRDGSRPGGGWPEREEKDSRDRDRERERRRAERDGERGTERERKRDDGRVVDRERDRERTREKERDRDKHRDREHNYERREKERDRERGQSSKHVKEMNNYKDELQEKYYESKKENERRERHSEREHSRWKEDKEYQEQRRKEKEDRERRHRERDEHHSRENRRHEERPREEDRERRRHAERREEESRHRLSGDGDRRDRRSHDQPGKRRPAGEEDGENGLAGTTLEARLRSGRDGAGGRSEPKEPEVDKEEVETEKVSGEGQGDDGGDEYYEEDFEDYEDDFEEVNESDGEEDDDGEKSDEGNKEKELSPQKRREIEEIRRAMNAENERVGSSQPRHAAEESEKPNGNSDVPQRRNAQHGKFIDFVAARHREVGKKIASKQKKRSAELLRLIDLDFSITFPLLDLPPVNEYDMYIKSFGTTNTKQAYVQCNEDNTDRDIQTEEIEAEEKWTQHPGDGRVVCGGPKLVSETSDEAMARMNIDSKRLAEFLLSASQVVAVLLEEDRAEMHSQRKLKSQERTLSCSDACVQLNTKLPFLHGREVSLLCFSQVQRQTLLSVHSPAAKPSAVRLDSKTILCVWNMWEPSRPQKVLVYESEVLCCCFSPGKATLVFAGTAVGSVAVWDLREHSGLHQTLTIGDNDWVLRYPTFSTDSVLSPVAHFSSVRSVEPVPVAVAEGVRPELFLLPSHQESSGLSFQLASLDESGVMNLWVVVELPKADHAGSQTDLGLKPGGKVKLLHSSSLITNERASQRDALNTGPLHTLLLKFLPSDSNHFFIGTDMGVVTHGTRHGLKIPPKFYRPQEEGLRPVHITAVDVSPFSESLFLVGCADGSVRMHSVRSEQPVKEWSRGTAGQPVLSVQWALTRPAVFCVLDAASNLHVWDLLEKDYEPVVTEKLHSDRVTAMAVFGDPAKPNTLSGVSLARQSGEIDIQYFTKRWAVPTPAEMDTLHNILNEAF